MVHNYNHKYTALHLETYSNVHMSQSACVHARVIQLASIHLHFHESVNICEFKYLEKSTVRYTLCHPIKMAVDNIPYTYTYS